MSNIGPVRTVKAGEDYRVTIDDVPYRLMLDDEDIVWFYRPNALHGGYSLARFGGALSPESIRTFLARAQS